MGLEIKLRKKNKFKMDIVVLHKKSYIMSGNGKKIGEVLFKEDKHSYIRIDRRKLAFFLQKGARIQNNLFKYLIG